MEVPESDNIEQLRALVTRTMGHLGKLAGHANMSATWILDHHGKTTFFQNPFTLHTVRALHHVDLSTGPDDGPRINGVSVTLPTSLIEVLQPPTAQTTTVGVEMQTAMGVPVVAEFPLLGTPNVALLGRDRSVIAAIEDPRSGAEMNFRDGLTRVYASHLVGAGAVTGALGGAAAQYGAEWLAAVPVHHEGESLLDQWHQVSPNMAETVIADAVAVGLRSA